VLIQTMNPSYARFKPGTGLLRQWWHRATKRIDLERDNLSNRGISYFGERCRDVADIARAKAALAFDNRFRGGRRKGNLPMRYILEALRQEHAIAYAKYAVRPHRGDVLLLRARKQLSGLMIDETSGWKNFVQGRLEVCHVPGHQQNLLSEPNVIPLAEVLATRLQSAQKSHAEPDQLEVSAPEGRSFVAQAR
jgi:hypothetical protein